MPFDERDKESNLLLLCGKHHDFIDNMPQLYTVERLRQIKEDHENIIRKSTGEALLEAILQPFFYIYESEKSIVL